MTVVSRIISEKSFCGLDIGSSKIKAGILSAKNSSSIELLGVVENATKGYAKGSVTDLKEFSNCIQATLHDLSKKTNIKFKDVYLGVSGDFLDIRQVHAEIPLIDRGGKVIVERDIKRLNKQARLLSTKMEEEILHELPQMYRVDEINSAINPLGLYGRKLAVNSSMVIMHTNRIHNIYKAIQQAGYDVVHTFFSTCAASNVVLNEEQKKKGCILVDVGATTTTLIVFNDQAIQHIARLPLGGQQLTERIAQAINVSNDIAEEIKKSYAGAFRLDFANEEEVLIKKESQYLPVKKRDIYKAIEGDIHYLIDFIQTQINMVDSTKNFPHGIIMVGGGAQLTGLLDRIHDSTNLPVRLGTASVLDDKPLNGSPKYISVIGLAQTGFQKSIRYTLTSSEHTDWLKGFLHRINELYHEYF